MSERFELDQFIDKQNKEKHTEADEVVGKAPNQVRVNFDDAELLKKYYEENYPQYKPGEERKTLDQEKDLDFIGKPKEGFSENDMREVYRKMKNLNRNAISEVIDVWDKKKDEVFLLQEKFKKEYLKSMKEPTLEALRIHRKLMLAKKELSEISERINTISATRDQLN